MPHATENLTNGDMPSSKFLSHLNSYPVVSDGVETFKSNPYGKKSLELADSAYARFGKPVEPYLETPISYAKPYVAKADELADSGLGHVESTFPIVKENTNTIVDKGKSVFWFPFKVANDSKDYVINTWSDEYNKTASHKDRGTGISTLIMALISTELKIASDFFQTIADFLGPKYEEGKKKSPDYVKNALNTAEQYAEAGKDKAQQYADAGKDKAQQYKKAGEDKAEEAEKFGKEKTDQAKQEAQKAKDEAQKKTQK